MPHFRLTSWRKPAASTRAAQDSRKRSADCWRWQETTRTHSTVSRLETVASSTGLPRVGQSCAWSGLLHWIGIAQIQTEVGGTAGGRQGTDEICLGSKMPHQPGGRGHPVERTASTGGRVEVAFREAGAWSTSVASHERRLQRRTHRYGTVRRLGVPQFFTCTTMLGLVPTRPVTPYAKLCTV